MRTLILNGSPRKKGDTAALIDAFTRLLHEEYRVIDCYSANIAPCMDCRCCREKLSCPINDKMQEIYDYLSDCDNLILASPVHYAELSSGLLKVASRFQIYSSALIFRHEKLPLHIRRGAVLFAQGGSGGAERAYETARLIFQGLGITEIYPLIYSEQTDRLAAADDEKALHEAAKLAAWLNTFDHPQQTVREMPRVTKHSAPDEKIALFRSLFRGREDVYALQSPVCS